MHQAVHPAVHPAVQRAPLVHSAVYRIPLMPQHRSGDVGHRSVEGHRSKDLGHHSKKGGGRSAAPGGSSSRRGEDSRRHRGADRGHHLVEDVVLDLGVSPATVGATDSTAVAPAPKETALSGIQQVLVDLSGATNAGDSGVSPTINPLDPKGGAKRVKTATTAAVLPAEDAGREKGGQAEGEGKGEGSFSCDHCTKGPYTSKYSLKRHVLQSHASEGLGWECPVCSFPFADIRNADLRRHMKTHGEHPWVEGKLPKPGRITINPPGRGHVLAYRKSSSTVSTPRSCMPSIPRSSRSSPGGSEWDQSPSFSLGTPAGSATPGAVLDQVAEAAKTLQLLDPGTPRRTPVQPVAVVLPTPATPTQMPLLTPRAMAQFFEWQSIQDNLSRELSEVRHRPHRNRGPWGCPLPSSSDCPCPPTPWLPP